MEESNISNSEKDIQNINIFLHIIKPEFIPVDTVYVSVNDITTYVDGSVDQIIINDLLDYLPYNEITNILDIIFSKLKVSGKLIIQAPDLYKLCSSCAFEDIDIDTVKIVLYGNKKSIHTAYDIQTEIKNRNMIIKEQKFINIFEYYIDAEKV